MKYIRIAAIALFFHIVMNLFMPWWNIFIAGLIDGYFSGISALRTFLVVFLALSAYWTILILQIDNMNDHILSSRIAELLSVPNNLLLIILNSFIGGICCAVGSQAGYQLKKIIRQRRDQA